jgi:hypothetical protein
MELIASLLLLIRRWTLTSTLKARMADEVQFYARAETWPRIED